MGLPMTSSLPAPDADVLAVAIVCSPTSWSLYPAGSSRMRPAGRAWLAALGRKLSDLAGCDVRREFAELAMHRTKIR